MGRRTPNDQCEREQETTCQTTQVFLWLTYFLYAVRIAQSTLTSRQYDRRMPQGSHTSRSTRLTCLQRRRMITVPSLRQADAPNPRAKTNGEPRLRRVHVDPWPSAHSHTNGPKIHRLHRFSCIKRRTARAPHAPRAPSTFTPDPPRHADPSARAHCPTSRPAGVSHITTSLLHGRTLPTAVPNDQTRRDVDASVAVRLRATLLRLSCRMRLQLRITMHWVARASSLCILCSARR